MSPDSPGRISRRSFPKNLRSANDKPIVIPGHGPIGDKTSLVNYDQMINAVHEKVVALKRQGRSKLSADFDREWGGPETFVELLYTGVQGGTAI